MTTVDALERYASKSVLGECRHGTKAVERSGKEASKGRPNAAERQGLRRGGAGRGGGAANREHLEEAAQ